MVCAWRHVPIIHILVIYYFIHLIICATTFIFIVILALPFSGGCKQEPHTFPLFKDPRFHGDDTVSNCDKNMTYL